MTDRTIEIRRRGKGDLLAAGVVHGDGTVEAFVAGHHVISSNVADLEARCAELSTTGVDVAVKAAA